MTRVESTAKIHNHNNEVQLQVLVGLDGFAQEQYDDLDALMLDTNHWYHWYTAYISCQITVVHVYAYCDWAHPAKSADQQQERGHGRSLTITAIAAVAARGDAHCQSCVRVAARIALS